MIKFNVMYPRVPGMRFDHDYYRDKHMPMLARRLGPACLYYTVDKGLAGGGTRSAFAFCRRLQHLAGHLDQRLGG
jgi:uncharacterized protein (TIGR02118 family)